jgi:TolB-like protein/DNA-binding winged helix-turn-helix (wHTH) protein/tetratricopeptide (TPR) repeat protein
MPHSDKELYEFDKFRLDVSERILWREGERVPLSEKSFETLCALVRRGNHLVGKDELLSEVWADAVVEENNLDKNISVLRQVLGERAGRGKFIETVRGHGFRFVPEVREIGGGEKSRGVGYAANSETPALAAEPPDLSAVAAGPFQDGEDGRGGEEGLENQNPNSESQITPTDDQRRTNEHTVDDPQTTPRGRGRLITLAVFGLLVLGSLGLYLWRRIAMPAPPARINTLAVLPFRPLLAEDRNEALEMGMADTLISKLSGGEDITVRPLSSVRRYIALEQDSLSAGRELNVGAVLDGSIQRSGERIRISARLIQTGDGRQLWAGQFDEKFTDIFAVQDAISDRVATALKVQLGGGGKKHYTENVEAYQLYMKGRFHLLKGIGSETETGIAYFQQAIGVDPNYALAYTGLADAYRGRTVGGEMPSAEFMPKARAAALRAIEIDDTLAEAHANLGHIMFWYDWDWGAAENQHRRALQLDPNSPDALQFYAHLLSSTGRHAEALDKIRRARELDPVNLRVNAIEGMLLLHAGRTDEAIDRLQKTLELDPNHRLVNMMAARAYTEKGIFAEAVAATRRARGLSSASSEPIAYGTYALAKAGRLAEARAALDEMMGSSKTRHVPPYNIALIYNALGERALALDYLELGYEQKDVRMVFLKVEPKWNNLRAEPRFVELMKRMRFEL